MTFHRLILLCFITWVNYSCQHSHSNKEFVQNNTQTLKESPNIDSIDTSFCKAILHLLSINKVSHFIYIESPLVSEVRVFYNNDSNCLDGMVRSKWLKFIQSSFSPSLVMAGRSNKHKGLPDHIRRIYVVDYSFDQQTLKWTLKIFVENSGALVRLMYNQNGIYQLEKDLILGYI